MAVLEQTTAKRLATIVRKILGSDFDGEVLASVAAARRVLASEGLSPNDVGTVIENANGEIEALKYSDTDADKIYKQGLAEGRAEGLRGSADFYDEAGEPRWHAMALVCRAQPERLRANEQKFIDDIAGQTVWREPTEKQAQWLLSLFVKLGGRKPSR